MDEREIVFLGLFYGNDSPTKGKQVDSCIEAGYKPSVALKKSGQIIRKYEDCSFRSSAKAVGITKPYLAMKLRQIMDQGNDKEILAGIRLALANFGEATDQQGGAAANTFNAPVMIIQGMTQEKMKALREAIPQLTREQEEDLSNERSAQKLEMLKRGELPPLVKSKARNNYIYRRPVVIPEGNVQEAAVSNIDSGDAGGDQQA